MPKAWKAKNSAYIREYCCCGRSACEAPSTLIHRHSQQLNISETSLRIKDFPLLTGRIRLSNKKRNFGKYSAAFFKAFSKNKKKCIWRTLYLIVLCYEYLKFSSSSAASSSVRFIFFLKHFSHQHSIQDDGPEIFKHNTSHIYTLKGISLWVYACMRWLGVCDFLTVRTLL